MGGGPVLRKAVLGLKQTKAGVQGAGRGAAGEGTWPSAHSEGPGPALPGGRGLFQNMVAPGGRTARPV